jgi:hypothetical protein
MKILFCACSFFCAMGMALAQTPVVAFSNLEGENPSQQGLPVGGPYEIGGSFTTGNTGGDLTAVTVALKGLVAPSEEAPGTFNLALYSDANGLPGANLGVVFSGTNNYPTNAGTYTYMSTSRFACATNTPYWVVAFASPPNVEYAWADSTNATYSTAGWSMNTYGALMEGSTWVSIGPGGYPSFSVTVTNLTQPSISILQAIVLVYPTPGFNFVPQQNSNLSTANWVNVTNAILSGTGSNQTIYILPPGSPKMFYRLGMQ